MGEIRQFAQEVIPKPRFLFDSYKTSESVINEEEESHNENKEIEKVEDKEDYFSFFSSHEKVILKPESNFKNVSIIACSHNS